MKVAKIIFYLIWIIIVIALAVTCLVNPTFFSLAHLVEFIHQFEGQIWAVYICLSLLRGFFFLPSTPFVFLGVLLFPESPWLVFTVCLASIAVTTIGLYYFADFLGFNEKLKHKYPNKMKVWEKRLNSPYAGLFVILWSFFPFVPTDLIIYLAGVVKMPFKILFTGVMIGEIVLIYCYVFFGKGLLEMI